MLNESPFEPENRQLYTDILRPPEGYRFDCAVATTFSLDFETALAIPAAIVFQDAENREDILDNPLALLEGIERVADRIAIYCDHGRIKGAKPASSRLMALFENSIKEVVAPGGGAFHPKMWCLRFKPVERNKPVKLRCVILSRNLTCDRSWDLSLCLEGIPGKTQNAVNNRLVSLIQALPAFARDKAHQDTPDFIENICEDLSRCKWDIPVGAKSVSFSVNGIDDMCWQLPKGKRLTVISPFISRRALQALQDNISSSEGCELISRAEELDQIPAKKLCGFSKLLMLNEDRLEDTEAGGDSEGAKDINGLHAKAYLVEKGANITLSVGSANATGAALIPSRSGLTKNVEIIASLTGTQRKMGTIDDFLHSGGFPDLLSEYARSKPADNTEQKAAKKTLETLRATIAGIPFSIDCEPDENKKISLSLENRIPVKKAFFEGVECRFRMLSSENDYGWDAIPFLIDPKKTLDLGTFILEDVSRWIVVRLRHCETNTVDTFTLGSTLNGLPEGRDAALRRALIGNSEGFLRYLQLLLGFAGNEDSFNGKSGGAESWSKVIGRADSSLLESLLLCLHSGGEELNSIDRLMDNLTDPESGESIVPNDFKTLWESFKPFVSRSKAKV